ncbi:MAG: nuclear transport factor 2 family protein [Ginsengibacter sp.]
MKKLLTCLAILLVVTTYAQSKAEIEIRKLEDAQREAFQKKDTAALYKLFSPNFVVNAPTNKITTLQELMQLMRQGAVDMEEFVRITEKVTFTKNLAIAMGNETLHPTGKMPNAGKTVKRRYTNIWMKNKGGWQLCARQSTIISVE